MIRESSFEAPSKYKPLDPSEVYGTLSKQNVWLGNRAFCLFLQLNLILCSAIVSSWPGLLLLLSVHVILLPGILRWTGDYWTRTLLAKIDS